MNKLSDRLLLIKNKHKHLVSFLNDVKKYKVLIDEIEKTTQYLPNDCKLSQRIFNIIANKTNLTLCKECSNAVKFLDLTRGYSKFCSVRCSANSKETRRKFKETCFKIYGSFSPSESKEIKETESEIVNLDIDRITTFDIDQHHSWINLVITIGGDGTILYASKIFAFKQCPPLVCFSMGSLGYLCNFKI